MIEAKKSLTPEEVLIVTHGVMTYGIPQHHLAGLYGVDSGRIAEAVVAMRWAMENHRVIYKHVQRLKGKGNGRRRPVEVPDEPLKLESPDPFHPSNRGFDGPGGAE
jgi:hypothetical protein